MVHSIENTDFEKKKFRGKVEGGGDEQLIISKEETDPFSDTGLKSFFLSVASQFSTSFILKTDFEEERMRKIAALLRPYRGSSANPTLHFFFYPREQKPPYSELIFVPFIQY